MQDALPPPMLPPEDPKSGSKQDPRDANQGPVKKPVLVATFWKIPAPRKLFRDGFWFGYLLSTLTSGIVMDIIGKDRMMNVIRDTWVDSNWTMPIQTVLFVTFGMFAFGIFRALPGRPKAPPKE